jgi:hypothetical protein
MSAQRSTTRARLRTAAIAALCIALGILTTLSLAWGPEVWRVVTWKPGTPVGTVNLDTYEATDPEGRVYRATRREQGLRGEEWNLDPKEFTAALEARFETRPRPKRSPPYWVPWPEPDKIPLNQRLSAPTLHASAAHACGWPLRCNYWTESTNAANFDSTTMNGVRWFRWDGSDHQLPGLVIWPGFLADTLLFAGAFWMLVTGPRAVRRWRRLRRGLCRACGYDRQGLPISVPCPECSHPGIC